MASRVSQSINGPVSRQSGNNPMSSNVAMSLPCVDAEKLKERLYSYAPKQALPNPRALRFQRPTNAQLKRAAIPSAPKLEPLVSYTALQSYLITR